MKLVGGAHDGRDVGDPRVPVLQADSTGRDDTTFYTRRTFFSFWPIPGWEMIEREQDVSKGPWDNEIYWRCRNYFTEGQTKLIEDFINTDLYISYVSEAYKQRDDEMIDGYLDSALKSAHQLAVLTGLDERTENEDADADSR